MDSGNGLRAEAGTGSLAAMRRRTKVSSTGCSPVSRKDTSYRLRQRQPPTRDALLTYVGSFSRTYTDDRFAIGPLNADATHYTDLENAIGVDLAKSG